MRNRARFLLPRVDPEAVARPLVQQRLDAAGDVPLTLLVAPPGFGKTTALAAWLNARPAGAVYFAAGGHDAHLTRFVRLFVAAIQTVSPGIGEATLGELRPSELPDVVVLAEALADELTASGQAVTVVVDDLHTVSTPDIDAFLGELLRFGLPALHLVLASRHNPSFPWARLRLEGRLHEIRASDLQLTETQVARALQHRGIPDPHGRLTNMIWQHAEGWPAGVRGLALALKDSPTPLSGDALYSGALFSHIDDFLSQEFFIQQSPEVQDALLRLAVLDRFDGELAEALIANTVSGATLGLPLAELMKACPYLESEDETGWIRFHPLFRRFLRHEYTRRYREPDRRVHSLRAGALLAARGMTDVAIRLLSDAGELDEAAAIVEREMSSVLARQDWRTLEAWLEALPQALVEARPWLMVGQIWVSHLSGRDALLITYVERIRRLIASGHPDAEALWGICTMFTVDVEGDPAAAVAKLQAAVAAIPRRERFAQGVVHFYLGLALHSCGKTEEALSWLAHWTEVNVEEIDAGFILAMQAGYFVQYAAGHLFASTESADAVLTLARRHDLPVAAAWAERGLGSVAYMQNRLDEAEQHFSAVLTSLDRCNLLCAAEAFAGLAYTYAAQGKLSEANTVLLQASDVLLERQAVGLIAKLRPVAAFLALHEDPPDVARALGLTNGVTIASGLLGQMRHPLLPRIMALVLAGRSQDLQEANAHLTTLDDRAAQIRYIPVQIEVGVLGAVLREREGDRATALTALRRVIARSAPERFWRPFLDLEPHLRPLLLELAERREDVEGLPALLAARGSPYDAVGYPADAVGYPAVSPSLELLTLREAEVLDLLADRLTYKEIAYQLSISPETVKRHVNSIYSKLDVASRREALLKAQELGWHPAA